MLYLHEEFEIVVYILRKRLATNRRDNISLLEKLRYPSRRYWSRTCSDIGENGATHTISRNGPPGLFQSCGKVIHEGSAMPAEGSLGPGLSHKLQSPAPQSLPSHDAKKIAKSDLVVFSHREQKRWLSLLHGLGMVSYPCAETKGCPRVKNKEAKARKPNMPRKFWIARNWLWLQ